MLFYSKGRLKDQIILRPKCKGIDRNILVHQSQGTHTHVNIEQEEGGKEKRKGEEKREEERE